MDDERIKELLKIKDLLNRSLGLMIEEASDLEVDPKDVKNILLDLSVLLMELEDDTSGLIPEDQLKIMKQQIVEQLDILDEGS